MVFFIAVCFFGNENCLASETPSKCIVLISMKIKPYLDALEGIKTFIKAFPEITIESFFLEDVEKSWPNEQPFLKGDYQKRSIVALGPEAAHFLNSNPPDQSIIKVFAMISNPSALIPQQDSSFCGIFLSVDAKEQVSWITKAIPDLKVLGILYDQRHNQEYVSTAQATGFEAGIRIQPLRVDSRDEVPDLLKKNWNKLDGLLLIPDATVISASLVKYIIKDGIKNKVPVIGYNRFFIQSGALMAFVYNYEQIGRETGSLVRELLLNPGTCKATSAAFTVVINQSIAKQLDKMVTRELKGVAIEENE